MQKITLKIENPRESRSVELDDELSYRTNAGRGHHD